MEKSFTQTNSRCLQASSYSKLYTAVQSDSDTCRVFFGLKHNVENRHQTVGTNKMLLGKAQYLGCVWVTISFFTQKYRLFYGMFVFLLSMIVASKLHDSHLLYDM